MIRRLFVTLLVVLLLTGAAAGGAVWWAQEQMGAPGPSAAAITVIIEKGDGIPEIAARLADAGVVDRGWLFAAEVHLAGKPVLKAGEYQFPAHASMATIIDMVHRAQVLEHKFTVAEGLTVRQVLTLLDQADGLTGGLLALPPEGTLLPQTYFYVRGDSRAALVARMSRAMTEVLAALWDKRKPGLPLADKAQAVVLASIVERETAVPDERPHIAAVFENRLRQHIRLQADPTVIYAASQGAGVLDRPISQKDLAAASPYNTYTADGLPPGPICNPGRASLEAVLDPADSDDLYFVADGSGRHVFAKTLAEHNKNVERWRQIEKNQQEAGKGQPG